MSRYRFAAASLLAALTVAACGSGSSGDKAPQSSAPAAAAPSSSAATAPASQPAPAPTPTEWSIAEAGQHYLELVAPANALVAEFRGLRAALETDVAVWNEFCGRYAAGEDQLARDFATSPWPAAVKPLIDQYVLALGKERTYLVSCSKAETYDAVNVSLGSMGDASTERSGIAQTIRVILGLPGTS